MDDTRAGLRVAAVLFACAGVAARAAHDRALVDDTGRGGGVADQGAVAEVAVFVGGAVAVGLARAGVDAGAGAGLAVVVGGAGDAVVAGAAVSDGGDLAATACRRAGGDVACVWCGADDLLAVWDAGREFIGIVADK